jgi:hypothetical protein
LEAIVNLITIKVLENVYPSERISELSKFAEFRGYYKYVWKRVYEIKDELKNKNLNIKEWIKVNPKIKR